TDIATGLASGQSPFMVLIQQGGQLKDMFGGIGPAARAVGGYVAALVNPFTVAAAAVGGLTAAYLVGAGEAREYQKALILTGNASATTVGRLQGMAEALSQSTGATKALAAEVLTSLVSTAQVTGDTMQRVGEAAIRMERAGVQSIDATVKQFEELGKRPVEASIKLNEQTNFLTAAIYGQIKALNEQGKEAEAAALAQGAYADEMSRRSRQVEDNLGTLERSWIDVKDAAKGAWDAMLNIGRQQSDEARIKELEGYGPYTGSIFTGRTQGQEEELKAARTRVELRRQEAEQQAKSNRETQAEIEWDKIRSPLLDKNKRAEIEIARVRQAGLAARKSELEIEALIAAVREKYAEKGGPKKKADSGFEDAAVAQAREYERLYTEGEKYRQSLVLQLEAGHELTKGEQLLAEAQRQRGTVQYELLKGLADEILALEKQIKDRKSAADFQKTWTDLQARQRKAMEGEVDSLIDGNKALALHNEEIGLSIEALGALNLSRIDSAIALKEEALAQEQAGEADAARIELLRQQIELLQKRRDLTAQGQQKEALVRVRNETLDLFRSVDDTAQRVFTDVAENGVSAFQRIGRTIKSAVLDLLYQITVKRWLISVAASASGSSLSQASQALGGSSNGGISLNGNLSSYAALTNNFSTNDLINSAGAYFGNGNLVSSGFVGPVNYVPNGFTGPLAPGQAYAPTFDTGGLGSAAGGLMAGFSAYNFGQKYGALGGFAGGVGTTALAGGIGGLMSGAGFMSGAAGALGALGPIGWAALAIGAILGGASKPSTPHAGAVVFGNENGTESPRTQAGIDAFYADPRQNQQFHETDFTRRYNVDMAKALEPIALNFAKSFNAITRQYGLGGGYQVGLGFSSDGDSKSRGRFSILDRDGVEIDDFLRKFSKNANKGMQEFGLAAGQALLQALRDMDLGGQVNAVLDKSLDGATDYLTRLTEDQTASLMTLLENGLLDDLTRNVDLANASWDSLIARVGSLAKIANLKPIFDNLGLSIVEVGVDITNAIGSIDATQGALQNYYAAFYSDAERLGVAQSQMSDQFALLNLALPKTRAEFRALVESLDLTTAKGQNTFATLMKIAPAFAEIDAAAQAAADEQRRLQDAAAQAA
ncbi:MAG: phage tail length tape measure family protein, partial [Piscinibacter sp.]|nr:phage tail length tape measure family protein [Piscinibacter sp.]